MSSYKTIKMKAGKQTVIFFSTFWTYFLWWHKIQSQCYMESSACTHAVLAECVFPSVSDLVYLSSNWCWKPTFSFCFLAEKGKVKLLQGKLWLGDTDYSYQFQYLHHSNILWTRSVFLLSMCSVSDKQPSGTQLQCS